jgi:hypothetical protein
VNESENPQRFVAYLCGRPLARRNRADEVGEGEGEDTKFDHAHTAVA